MDSGFDSNYYGPNQLHHKFQNLPDAFSIMHLNCRSLIPKINDLLSLLQLLPVKIVALTETWLTDELASSISVPGYQLIHKSRESDRYGGVGFLISNEVHFHEIIMKTKKTEAFESLFISLPQLKTNDITLGVIYRPPDGKVEEFNTDIEESINHLQANGHKNRPVFLMGDFNIDFLKCQQLHMPALTTLLT